MLSLRLLLGVGVREAAVVVAGVMAVVVPHTAR